MSFVSFGQLPNILKKAIYEKSKFAYSPISYENNKRTISFFYET